MHLTEVKTWTELNSAREKERKKCVFIVCLHLNYDMTIYKKAMIDEYDKYY